MKYYKVKNKKTQEISQCWGEVVLCNEENEHNNTSEDTLKWLYSSDVLGMHPLNMEDYEVIKNDDISSRVFEPFELFGIECGKGWYPLLIPIINYIDNYNKDKKEDEQIHFTQIKEKWGELEIYTNILTSELDGLIDIAREESNHTCEICGAKENVGKKINGWIETICHDCAITAYKGKVIWYKDGTKYIYQDGKEIASIKLNN